VLAGRYRAGRHPLVCEGATLDAARRIADNYRAMDEMEELRASRARVLEAADAERRRTERGLHDGVQQHLVALAVNLQLARQLADSDPGALNALLDELTRDVHEALESVRALARQFYPPLLLDRGLADALRSAAAEAGARVEMPTSDRFPPEVEAAVYFCCVELLRPGATVRLWAEEDSLVFEASGEPPPAVADRLGALGGSLKVEPGRTTGRVPLAP
jgi:signal transduction histidine kinase